MKKPDPQQPNVPQEFSNQRSIISQLYQIILQTTHTRCDIETSWDDLSRDDMVVDNHPHNNQ